MRLERWTRWVVLASTLAALWGDGWSASLVWPAVRWLVPGVFAGAYISGRMAPRFANAATLFACYLVPAVFITITGQFVLAEWSVWCAAVLGLILALRPVGEWSMPPVWRAALVFSALVVALTWPIVLFREADFHWNEV